MDKANFDELKAQLDRIEALLKKALSGAVADLEPQVDDREKASAEIAQLHARGINVREYLLAKAKRERSKPGRKSAGNPKKTSE